MEPYIKILGIVLLIAGIFLIGWTLVSAYNVFTGQTPVTEFFKVEEGAVETSNGGAQDIQAQVEKMIGEQLKGFLPVDSIPQLLNLIVQSMLSFILIFGGTQISSLGIKLIRNRVPQ